MALQTLFLSTLMLITGSYIINIYEAGIRTAVYKERKFGFLLPPFNDMKCTCYDTTSLEILKSSCNKEVGDVCQCVPIQKECYAHALRYELYYGDYSDYLNMTALTPFLNSIKDAATIVDDHLRVSIHEVLNMIKEGLRKFNIDPYIYIYIYIVKIGLSKKGVVMEYILHQRDSYL